MTTATLDNTTTPMADRPTLEELVDRLLAALLGEYAVPAANSVARSIHEARRLRQAGDLDGALAVLGNAATGAAYESEARWLYTEWAELVRRRWSDSSLLVYRQGLARAAALVAREGSDTLEVVAALGMLWPVGKVVSRRSLRGLNPLASQAQGGE